MRKTAPRPSLKKLLKLLSQGLAVELRAAQQMLMQFARLKSSYPIDSFGNSLFDRPTLARHYQCDFVRESQLGPVWQQTGSCPCRKHHCVRGNR